MVNKLHALPKLYVDAKGSCKSLWLQSTFLHQLAIVGQMFVFLICGISDNISLYNKAEVSFGPMCENI